MTNTKVALSEKIVTGLAIAVWLAAFATSVFTKPMNVSPHGSGSVAHVMTTGRIATTDPRALVDGTGWLR
jgi:hypothetical protein